MAQKTTAGGSNRGRGSERDDMLSTYLSSIGRVPLLSAEEEHNLARELREAEVDTWTLLLRVPGVRQLLDNEALRPAGFVATAELSLLLKQGHSLLDDATLELRVRVAEALREADDDRTLVAQVMSIIGDDSVNGAELRAVMAKAKAARARALRTRNHFIRANLRLVVSIARRFHHHRMPLIDLIQEGNLGLMKSVHRFDHRKGFRFSTYAHWWIKQSIERAIMNKGTQVRIPVHLFDQRREVQRAAHDLTQKLRRPPTLPELAVHLGIGVARLQEVIGAVPREPCSLDEPFGGEEDRTLGETLANHDQLGPDDHV
ncbi:MAG: RNA polymerase sigma factor RpoD/SigA, partial [Myxococcota bacterium]